jgi:hypothetical protein
MLLRLGLNPGEGEIPGHLSGELGRNHVPALQPGASGQKKGERQEKDPISHSNPLLPRALCLSSSDLFHWQEHYTL